MSSHPTKYGWNPQEPRFPEAWETKHTTEIMEERFPNPNQLSNKKYSVLLSNYYVCMFTYFDNLGYFPKKVE